MGVIKRIRAPLTHKGKKFLQKKEPQIVEDAKQSVFIRGRKTNETLTSCLKDLYSLKKPDAVMLGKKNDILPFENISPVEVFCQKFNAAMFAFASSNKKRPNSLVLGRTYDGSFLDMIELNLKKYKAMKEFPSDKMTLGIKSCLLFAGEQFETKEELVRLKNLLIDFFQREPVSAVRLQGLEHVIMFTVLEDIIYLRSYRIIMKNSGADTPRVELEEIGPSIDLSLGRTKLASQDLFKLACKKPKELKAKTVKNVSKDAFGTKHARIHVSKQKISEIQIKKMKGLRRAPKEPRKKKATIKTKKTVLNN